MRGRFTLCTLVVLVACLAAGGDLWGDLVTLKDGREWEGTIESESGQNVVIGTVGGPVTVPRTDIAEIHRGPTRRQQYQERRAALTQDDVDGHLSLARWCRTQGFAREARYHFQLALALDPQNTEAHQALGHQQVDGRWLTHEEAMAARGLVRYEGRWMDPAEAERAKDEKLRRELERSWRKRLGGLVRAILIGTPTERSRATAELLAVEDPVAGTPVVGLLEHRDPRIRALAVTVVEARGFRGGDEPLVKLALGSTDSEVRRLARLALVKTGGGVALKLLVGALASDKEVVRGRSAVVLGAIGDPRAVPALIESIRETVVTGSTSGPVVGRLGARDSRIPTGIDTITAPGVVVYKPRIERISSAVGSGSAGRIVVKVLVNYEAVDALEAITGLEFGDDQDAWRRWWRQEGRSFLRGLRSSR